MREVLIKAYEAFDGTRFDSPLKCREYEQASLHLRLSGLTVEQVKAALDRSDPDLAEALERAGLLIRAARRKAGDFRRPRAAVSHGTEPGHAPALAAS